MEQMATPGSVLMTADALQLAEGYVQVKSLGPVPVKGMSEPVVVYEVTGAGAARTRLQAAASRGLSRFVGRDSETEQLRKALEQARARHGQVVAVVGEPGVGKSRLFFEFTHSHRTEGCLIVESGSVSYGKATPYLPVIDLLKAYFKIQDRDNQRDDLRESHWQAPDTGQDSGARAAGAPVALRCRGGRSAMAKLRSAPAPPAHLGSDQAFVVARESSSTFAPGLRGSALGRFGDPIVLGQLDR